MTTTDNIRKFIQEAREVRAGIDDDFRWKTENKQTQAALAWARNNIFCAHAANNYTRLLDALEMAVGALNRSDCDKVINREGSGMFNKHDPNCLKCAALSDINALLERRRLP